METPVGAKIKQIQKITQLFVVINIDGSHGAINKHEQTMPRKAKRRPPARQPEQSSQAQETNIQVPSDQVCPEAIAISEERLDDINGFIETKDRSDMHAAQCVKRLHEGLAECRESLECCVCLERPIRFVITPCGHCVCGHEKCGSANLQECPVCRGPITQMTKTFGPACAISDALDTCQKLTDQISVLHAEASSLQGPFMALALQWRTRFHQVSDLKREIAGFQLEVGNLSNENCELATTVLEKCGDIEEYKAQLTAMEEKKVSLRNMYAANLSAHKEELDRKNDRIEALLSWSRLLEEDLAEANGNLERCRQEIEALSSELRQLKAEHAAANEEKEEWKLSNMHHTHWMLWKFNKFKEKHAWLKHANRFLAKQLQKSKARSDRGQATSCKSRPTVEEEMGMRSSLTSSIDRDIDTLFRMSALSERASSLSQTDSAVPRKSRHTPDCSAHCLKMSKRETPCLNTGF